MTDDELLNISRPPEALAQAWKSGDETGLGELLDLLFACHALVDEVDDAALWFQHDIALEIARRYEDGKITPALKAIAPSWKDAIRVSEEWLSQWPHDCGEFDWWEWRRDELQDSSAIAFFRGMMESRCPQPEERS